MNGGPPGSYLIVASVDGELFGVVPDNKLSDEGWVAGAEWGGCLLNGFVFTKAQLDGISKEKA